MLVLLILGSLLPLLTVAQTCNGYASFCTKTYDSLVYIGAHDSFAVSNTMTNVAANQAFNVTTQLQNGIRLLQGQVHLKGDVLQLCHTSCLLLDGGTLQAYLGHIKDFLDDNPTEVVTALFVNSDSQPAASFAAAYEAAGLVSYSYIPQSTPVTPGEWPTLQQLIQSNTRLVSWLATGADYSVSAYLLDEFSMIWETPFNSVDASFPCSVDRPAGQSTGRMGLVNHFLDSPTTILGQSAVIPDTDALSTTNSAASIIDNMQRCSSLVGRMPTYVLTDYYHANNGSVFEAEATLNGVTYQPRAIGNASISSTSAEGVVESTTSTASISKRFLPLTLTLVMVILGI